MSTANAVGVLVHYFERALGGHQTDMHAEIESAVDSIVSSAVHDAQMVEMEIVLRDEFAGRALQGILAAAGDSVSHDLGPNARASCEKAAHWAYQYADAMLAERAKRGGR